MLSCSASGGDSRDTLNLGKEISVLPFCSRACQQKGLDYGTCELNAQNAAGAAGELGCAPADTCSCARLAISSASCSRVGERDGSGIYNMSYLLTWPLGDSVKIDSAVFRDHALPFSRILPASALYRSNLTIFEDNIPVYRTSKSALCVAMPQIRVRQPSPEAALRGIAKAEAVVVDGARTELFIDDISKGSREGSRVLFDLDTTLYNDGPHKLRLESCNAAGCSSSAQRFFVANSAPYAFSLDPLFTTARAPAGSSATIEFRVKNLGYIDDNYIVEGSLDKPWGHSLLVEGSSYAKAFALAKGEEKALTAGIAIPQSERVLSSAAYTLTLTSRKSFRTAKATARIIVSTEHQGPPKIFALFHAPQAVEEGKDIAFFADIAAGSGAQMAQAIICKDSACAQRWCALAFASEGLSSCTAKPAKGNHTYYLLAEDTRGLQALSGERSFVVSSAIAVESNLVTPAAKITASSQLPGQPASFVADGDPGTYWVSSQGLPQYIVVDLGSVKAISGAGIFSSSPARPKEFRIEGAVDCSAFERGTPAVLKDERSAAYGRDSWHRSSFEPAYARCVRLYTTAAEDGSDYAAVAHLEIYESPTKPALPPPETISPGQTGTEGGGNILLYMAVAAIVIAAAIYAAKGKLKLWLEYRGY